MADVISKIQLNVIEKSLDKLFNKVGIDVEFSKHFFDRINDPRNVDQITISELINIYHSLYDKFGVKLSKTSKEVEELVKSLSTDINIPINLHFNRKDNKLEMVAKTIMRKKGFKSSSPVLAVESFKEFIARQLQEETGSEMGARILADMEKGWPPHSAITNSELQAAEYKKNLKRYFVTVYGKEHKKDIEKVLNTEIERLGGNVLTGPKNLRGATNMRILRSLVKLNIIKSS